MLRRWNKRKDGDVWVGEMNTVIGQEGKVLDIVSQRVYVDFPKLRGYNFPPSSLELVKD